MKKTEIFLSVLLAAVVFSLCVLMASLIAPGDTNAAHGSSRDY